jgi:Family of unknown function (DUF6459)
MTITVTDVHTDVPAGRQATVTNLADRMPRRVPAPAGMPFDDERPTTGRPQSTSRAQPNGNTQGALALADGRRRPIAPWPHLRLVPDTGKPLSRRVVDDQTLFGRQPTSTSELPDPSSWAGQLARAVTEVLAGDRPLPQLMRWTDETVFADLSRRTTALAQAGAGRRGPRNRVGVRSVHVCEPRDGVIEASVHVRQGHRSRALALRLEGLDGRWRCTALQIA